MPSVRQDQVVAADSVFSETRLIQEESELRPSIYQF